MIYGVVFVIFSEAFVISIVVFVIFSVVFVFVFVLVKKLGAISVCVHLHLATTSTFLLLEQFQLEFENIRN